MPMIPSTQKRRQAFSLVEIAIVLMVFGIVLSGLWLASAQVWDYTRREQAREAITTTVANMRSYYGGQPGIPGSAFTALTSQLITANVIPGSLQRPGGCGGGTLCADHPWGSFSGGTQDTSGTFRVCNWTIGASESTSCATTASLSSFFGIALTGLTPKSCIAVVESMSSATEPTGLVEININGVNLLASGNSIQPVSDALVNSSTPPTCMASANANVVTFVYRVIAPQP